MKKISLFFLLVTLFTNNLWAQSAITAPEDYNYRFTNAHLILKALNRAHEGRAIKDPQNYMEIPVYLDYFKDTKINYYWYETKMVFGEKVRTSEKPIKTIEGTYTNGRLSFYKSGKAGGQYYRLNWSSDGKITSITEYSEDGSERYTFRPASITNKTIKLPGNLLTSESSMKLYDVIIDDTLKSDNGKHIYYSVYEYVGDGENARLKYMQVNANKERNAWKTERFERDYLSIKIFRNGQLAPASNHNPVFNPNDPVRCSSQIEY